MIQNSTTHTYSLLKVTKSPSSSKMMMSTSMHRLQGQRMSNTVLVRSPEGTIVTQNKNLIMIMFLLRLQIIFFILEVMVY